MPCRAARWAEISGTAQPALRAVPARPSCFRAGPGFVPRFSGRARASPLSTAQIYSSKQSDSGLIFCLWNGAGGLTPVRNRVFERVDNVKRGRGRSKLTWDESVKRDLKDWNIPKKWLWLGALGD